MHYQARCTSIAPATRHFLFTIGLTRPARKPWIEIERAWQSFLTPLRRANPGARAYAERVGLQSTGKIRSYDFEAGLLTQIPKEFDFESSHWPPNCAILDHSMTAMAE